MKASKILQPQTTATHRLQKHRYIVFKMQGIDFLINISIDLIISLKMPLPLIISKLNFYLNHRIADYYFIKSIYFQLQL